MGEMLLGTVKPLQEPQLLYLIQAPGFRDCSFTPALTARSLQHPLEPQSHSELGAKKTSPERRLQPQAVAAQQRSTPCGWGSFAGHREPVALELTCSATLLVLSESLKPPAWVLLSLARPILFAQPPCRLRSPGERSGRQSSSAGSLALSCGSSGSLSPAGLRPCFLPMQSKSSGQICPVFFRELQSGARTLPAASPAPPGLCTLGAGSSRQQRKALCNLPPGPSLTFKR